MFVRSLPLACVECLEIEPVFLEIEPVFLDTPYGGASKISGVT